MEGYNVERTYTGKYCYGKTPLQTFIESATLAYDKQLIGSTRHQSRQLQPLSRVSSIKSRLRRCNPPPSVGSGYKPKLARVN